LEKTWIGRGNPSKVIEKKEVHYFHFPVEIGFPPKSPDLEPIKIVRFNQKILALTRFHYKIQVYFNQPKVQNDRALADFSLGSHSPFIHSMEGSTMGTRIALEKFDALEAEWVRFIMATCIKILSGKLHTSSGTLKDYNLVEGKIKKDTIFDAKKCHSVVWIGSFPEKHDTPQEVWSVLKN
jgi:hypothetical protein